MKKFLFLVSILVNIESFAGTTENIDSSAKTTENIDSSAKKALVVYSEFLATAQKIKSAEKNNDFKYSHPYCGDGYCTVSAETSEILNEQFQGSIAIISIFNSQKESLFTYVFPNKFKYKKLNENKYLIITHPRNIKNSFLSKVDMIYSVYNIENKTFIEFDDADPKLNFLDTWCEWHDGIVDKKTNSCSADVDQIEGSN